MTQNVWSRVKQALSCSILALVWISFAGEKHFIGHSWDLLKVTTDDLVRNLPELEKLPLSGISISLSAKSADGKRTFYTRDILSDPAWDKKNYLCINAFNACNDDNFCVYIQNIACFSTY